MPGSQVLDADGVGLAAVGVDRIRQQVVVGADLDGAEAEEVVAAGQRTLVEQQFLLGVQTAPLAAVVVVFLALLGARVIETIADALRNGRVVLLDPGHHLVVELVPQCLGRLHHRRGVSVLRFEVGQHPRVAAPVVAQPTVGVGHLPAVASLGVQDLLRFRRLHRGGY